MESKKARKKSLQNEDEAMQEEEAALQAELMQEGPESKEGAVPGEG